MVPMFQVVFFPASLEYLNLNNLIEKESIIHALPKEEWIDGIQKPLCYVGMKNSVFATHAEDRYLGALNYLHMGDPKIWYGFNRNDEKKIMEPTALKAADIDYCVVNNLFRFF